MFPHPVRAASGAVPAPTVPDTAAGTSPTPDDLLVHDFDAWTGVNPPGTQTRADIHATGEEESVNTNKESFFGAGGLTSRADEDKISVADSVSDVAPPPPSGIPAGLNPFTPEWFEQMISAAATAAATAVASSSRAPAPPSVNQTTPRRLNDRKVPDFWEDRPEFWFQIFDAHLGHFNPSERQCFDALLPLLTPAARNTVHSVIRTPGTTPYSKARDALLRHFGRTPRQLAREFLDTSHARVLGDRLPSEYLDHLLGLLPDPRTMYEVALLDALPATARVAALQLSGSSLHAMARAADAVVLEARAETDAARPVSVNAVSLLDSDCDSFVPPPLTPVLASISKDRRPSQPKPRQDSSICANHVRFGKETYKSLSPSSCKMSHVLRPKPTAPSTAASGNAKAGSRQ